MSDRSRPQGQRDESLGDERPERAGRKGDHPEIEEHDVREGALQADLDRLQQLERALAEWADQSRGFARETSDPRTWFAFVGLADNLEGQRRALEEIIRACGGKQGTVS